MYILTLQRIDELAAFGLVSAILSCLLLLSRQRENACCVIKQMIAGNDTSKPSCASICRRTTVMVYLHRVQCSWMGAET